MPYMKAGYFAAAAVLFAVAFTAEAAEVYVKYYNQAGVTTAALHKAADIVTHTFLVAGIQVRWMDCYLERLKCEQARAGRTIDVIITSRLPAGRTVEFQMAHALLAADGPGRYARLHWQNIRRYAEELDVPVATVLGYVVTHEIGHLLLNTGTHSATGVMKAVWRRSDRAPLAGRTIRFNGFEAAAMRRHLNAHTAVDEKRSPSAFLIWK